MIEGRESVLFISFSMTREVVGFAELCRGEKWVVRYGKLNQAYKRDRILDLPLHIILRCNAAGMSYLIVPLRFRALS